MKIKTIITLVVFNALTILSINAQNPYKYESKVVLIDAIKKNLFTNEKFSNLGSLEGEIAKYNGLGYKLGQITNVKGADNEDILVLVFERSTSFREAELYKLINELTTRIDTTSKKYTDSAIVVIQTNVLNYLKSIPNDVITQAYKDELTKKLLLLAEDKIKEVVEELKKEIRNQSKN
jgi:hypothetical protein